MLNALFDRLEIVRKLNQLNVFGELRKNAVGGDIDFTITELMLPRLAALTNDQRSRVLNILSDIDAADDSPALEREAKMVFAIRKADIEFEKVAIIFPRF